MRSIQDIINPKSETDLLKEQLEEALKKIGELEAKKIDEQIAKEDGKEKGKKKYYKVIVQNNDKAEGDPGLIDFFANQVRVILEPGRQALIGETAYENLTKRSIQIRYRPISETEFVKEPFTRFPVITLDELELTEEEREIEVEKINAENEKQKKKEREQVA